MVIIMVGRYPVGRKVLTAYTDLGFIRQIVSQIYDVLFWHFWSTINVLLFSVLMSACEQFVSVELCGKFVDHLFELMLYVPVNNLSLILRV